LEERVASLETAAQRHEQTIARLVSIAENHDQLLERLLASQETLVSNQEAIVNLLEELTRDAATTRRLWLRLAQRYGRLDDEQNGAQPDTPT
jgi:ABC-type transporter Mla subunit MlaD